MSMHRRRYCVANWKMNFTLSDAKSFLSKWQNKDLNNTHIKTIFCPSFTELFHLGELLKLSSSELGAEFGGPEVGGAEVGGAEVGGAEVGGPEVGGAEVGGAKE